MAEHYGHPWNPPSAAFAQSRPDLLVKQPPAPGEAPDTAGLADWACQRSQTDRSWDH